VNPFYGPDDVVRRFNLAFQQCSSPYNGTLSGENGLLRAKRCGDPECNGKTHTWKLDGSLICKRCGGLWPVELKILGRHEYQAPRRFGIRHDRLSELWDLLAIIQVPKLWQRRSWVLYVSHESFMTYDLAARIMRREWPHKKSGLNKYNIKRLVAEARDAVRVHLERRELMAD